MSQSAQSRRRLVAVTATLLLSVVAPAFAAEKTLDVRDHGLTIVTPPFQDSLCGVTTTFVSTWLVREYSAVAWDDGHLHQSLKFRDEIRDSTTGVVIAEANVVHLESELVGSLPAHVTHHVTARCTPDTAQPGRDIVINFGLTINERGELTALHETVHA